MNKSHFFTNKYMKTKTKKNICFIFGRLFESNVKTQRNVVSDFPGFAAKVPPPKKMPDGVKTP
jgi:hypothetical protein